MRHNQPCDISGNRRHKRATFECRHCTTASTGDQSLILAAHLSDGCCDAEARRMRGGSHRCGAITVNTAIQQTKNSLFEHTAGRNAVFFYREECGGEVVA